MLPSQRRSKVPRTKKNIYKKSFILSAIAVKLVKMVVLSKLIPVICLLFKLDGILNDLMSPVILIYDDHSPACSCAMMCVSVCVCVCVCARVCVYVCIIIAHHCTCVHMCSVSVCLCVSMVVKNAENVDCDLI